MYTFGSAGTCSTDVANKRAFDRWKIVPAMLKECTNRSIEVSNRSRLIPLPHVFHLGRQRYSERGSKRPFSFHL